MEQYTVTGMSCAACSSRVEKAVLKVEGVTSCSVSLLTNSMGVEGTAKPEAVIAAVREAGYGAERKGEKPKGDDPLADRATPMLARRLLASLAFLAALMYVSMGHTMWGWPLPAILAENHAAAALAQLLLAGAVMVINQRFFINGFTGLIRRAPNMDTLVALGSGASFVYSVCVTFALLGAQSAGDHAAAAEYAHGLYFESAAMILALITVGKMLEARAKGKTTDALRSLMDLAPKTAVVVRGGEEVRVGVEQVRKGDIFALRPGESVPVDGVVTEGGGAVDESALTGESMPVDKAAGDEVFAGTVNRSGYMRCEAVKVGEDATLAQIIRMVSDAAATKAPIAKVADKVSGVFVPAVITVAAVTTIIWLLLGRGIGFALARGISVLVISCPCALGLATPVAIMVGSGLGARRGILFKTAASLERTGKIRIAALDKTGTITAGRPRVTDIEPEGCSEEELLALALSLESRSEHPLAGAVVAAAGERGISAEGAENFEALPGNGLRGRLGGEELIGGSMKFISSLAEIPPALSAMAETLSAEGKTPLLFARGGAVKGLIAVADVIKPEAAAAVGELKNMGVRVVMLTGDNERTARAIGAEAGVDEVVAGVLPDGKESAVRALAKEGPVLMVGDGINDAPALTRADIGMAIGAGSDVAIDAADVVLVKSRLSDVPAAVRLSRATLRNIHQNLFWAFIYNVIGIPLAAGAFYSLGLRLDPMFAAAAMSLSSFCVVTNALRLNFVDISNPKRDRKIRGSAPRKEEKTVEKTLVIEGMMCGHCEARVKKCLEELPGVESADVSHEKGTAVVRLTADVADDVLKSAVEAAGYEVK